MATRLKVVSEPSAADLAPPPAIPDFTPAPTRKRRAGWTADKQRKFIEHLALTGHAGEAAALVGLSSTSAYRLANRAGGEGFARAWDAAFRLATTRAAAIAWDRSLNGRVERFYRDGQLVMERRIPSDYLLTWLLSRLDPQQFGSPSAKALAAATGDPREKARKELPGLLEIFEDVPEEQCPTEGIDYLDDHLGETGNGQPISDEERG